VGTVPAHGSCGGSLIVHVIDRTAGCTLDDDIDGCQGLEERHDGAADLLAVVGSLRPMRDRAVTRFARPTRSLSSILVG
jgi:hypothetical protein